jgi:hypothetical protein
MFDKCIGVKSAISIACLLVLVLSTNQQVYANEIQTQGKVCGNPSAPCKPPVQTIMYPIYEARDLTFRLPQELQWQRNYYSAYFYAIILKSRRAINDDGPASEKVCSGYFTEKERIKVQKLFPFNKVFSSRFGCSWQPISYTNVNTQYNFMAIYAGETIDDARILLHRAKTQGFHDANIRKMQVVLGYGD